MSKYRLGAAILSATLIVGGLYFYEPPQAPPKDATQKLQEDETPRGVGVIDVEQIRAKLPDGALLDELRGREIRLRIELEEAMHPVFIPQLPEIDVKPFEDSAREKLMQEFMAKMSDLKAKQIVLIEKYRKETEEDYLKRRNEIRDEYFNEAVNLTLKMQNADNLYLTREEYDALQARLEEITAERNQRQGELREEWINEINSKVTAEISAEAATIRAEYEATYKTSEEESARKIREVEARNQALMDAAREVEYMQTRRQELYAELNDTVKQANEIENKIFARIASETGKLAAMLKLQTVFVLNEASVDANDFSLPRIKNTANFHPTSNTIVYAAGGITDLTKDLLKSMQLKGILNN